MEGPKLQDKQVENHNQIFLWIIVAGVLGIIFLTVCYFVIAEKEKAARDKGVIAAPIVGSPVQTAPPVKTPATGTK